MGVPFGLPPPPHINGPAGYAPQGGVAQGPTSGPYTLPYKPPVAANIVEGINAFMQNFKAMRDQDRARNQQLFQQDVQNMMLGLPVDMKKTARYAKRAGLNIDFENPAPSATQDRPAIPPQQIGTLPGAGGGIPVMQPGMPGIPAAPTPPPVSGFQHFLQGMGIAQPRFDPNSPGAQAMTALQGIGQQNLQTMQTEAQLKQKILGNQGMLAGIQAAALGGDPNALHMASRFQLANESPMDQLMWMGQQAGKSEAEVAKTAWYMHTGGPERAKLMWTLAQDMAKYMPHHDPMEAMAHLQDPTNPQFQPLALTPEEETARLGKILEYKTSKPLMPLSDATIVATAAMSGDPKLMQMANKIDAQYKSAKEIDMQQFKQNYGLELAKLNEMIRNNNLLDEQRVREAVERAAGEEFSNAQKILADPNAPQAQKTLAQQMMADSQAKMGDVKVKFRDGSTVTLGSKDIGIQRTSVWQHPLSWLSSEIFGTPMPTYLTAKQVLPPSPAQMQKDLTALTTPPAYMTNPAERLHYTEQAKRILKTIHLDLTGKDSVPASMVHKDVDWNDVAKQQAADMLNYLGAPAGIPGKEEATKPQQ